MQRQSTYHKLLIQSLAQELPQEDMINWNANLYARLNSVERYCKSEYSNIHIQKPVLGQNQHFAIQQATDETFSSNPNYHFRNTISEGAYFSTIELENFVIVTKRSVKPSEWGTAKHLRTLALANKKIDKSQLDLFTPAKPVVVDSKGNYITNKIMVIADVMYECDKLYLKFIIPSSSLSEVLIAVNYDDVIAEFEKPIDTKAKKVNPMPKLRKTIEKLDKKVSNQ